MVGDALGVATIDDTRGFADLGLDSIMAIDLRAGLAHALGVDLPSTVALDHPTVLAMADFLSESLPEAKRMSEVLGERMSEADGSAAARAPASVEFGSVGTVAEPVDLSTLSVEELIDAARQDLAMGL
jgi:acyl carrier protein